jgi:hypothetical protein
MCQRERQISDTCFSSSNLHSYSDQFAPNFPLEPETFSNDFANADELMKDTNSYLDDLSDCKLPADTTENGQYLISHVKPVSVLASNESSTVEVAPLVSRAGIKK